MPSSLMELRGEVPSFKHRIGKSFQAELTPLCAESKRNVRKAIPRLLSPGLSHRSQRKSKPDYHKRPWADAEIFAFDSCMYIHGKDFHAMKLADKNLSRRSVKDLVGYYYGIWKRGPKYSVWKAYNKSMKLGNTTERACENLVNLGLGSRQLRGASTTRLDRIDSSDDSRAANFPSQTSALQKLAEAYSSSEAEDSVHEMEISAARPIPQHPRDYTQFDPLPEDPSKRVWHQVYYDVDKRRIVKWSGSICLGRLSCDKCDAYFYHHAKLKVHQKICGSRQEGPKTSKHCPYCGKYIYHKSRMKKHMELCKQKCTPVPIKIKLHSKNSSKKIRQKGGRKAPPPSIVARQRKSDLGDPETHNCPKCNKYFYHVSRLKAHMITCTKPLRTPEPVTVMKSSGEEMDVMVCRARSSRKRNTHMCPKCGKSFYHTSRLEKHVEKCTAVGGASFLGIASSEPLFQIKYIYTRDRSAQVPLPAVENRKSGLIYYDASLQACVRWDGWRCRKELPCKKCGKSYFHPKTFASHKCFAGSVKKSNGETEGSEEKAILTTQPHFDEKLLCMVRKSALNGKDLPTRMCPICGEHAFTSKHYKMHLKKHHPAQYAAIIKNMKTTAFLGSFRGLKRNAARRDEEHAPTFDPRQHQSYVFHASNPNVSYVEQGFIIEARRIMGVKKKAKKKKTLALVSSEKKQVSDLKRHFILTFDSGNAQCVNGAKRAAPKKRNMSLVKKPRISGKDSVSEQTVANSCQSVKTSARPFTLEATESTSAPRHGGFREAGSTFLVEGLFGRIHKAQVTQTLMVQDLATGKSFNTEYEWACFVWRQNEIDPDKRPPMCSTLLKRVYCVPRGMDGQSIRSVQGFQTVAEISAPNV